MAKIIVKSSYLKPNARRNVGNYVRYIATRDGVEKIDESKKYLPATEKQKQIISRLLKACPDEAQNPCAVAYRNKLTRENATDFFCILRTNTRSFSAIVRTMSATSRSVPTWKRWTKITRTVCLRTTAFPLS